MWSSWQRCCPLRTTQGLVSYKLPSDAGIQAEILSLASKMHRQVCARNTAFESVSRSNSLAKNSDGLLAIQLLSTENTPYSRKLSPAYSLKYGFAGILDHGFLEAACCASCAGETNSRFELPNAQNWWWQISTKRRLTVSCRKDGLIAHVSEYQGPESLSPLYCFSGFLEAVISFHVHVHS